MEHTTQAAPRRRRRASDWAGFVGHAGIAILTIVRAPWISFFLLPSIVHLTLAACSFLLRDSPRAQWRDPLGRIVAYVGGFGVFVFVQLASVLRPEWLAQTTNVRLTVLGILCGLVGVVIEIWAIWHLRHAFATEPAARRFVTTGPYRFARHPIYSGACVAQLGLLLTHPTVPIALALAGWAVCISLRIRYEEAILVQTFPEYEDYRQRVGALMTSRGTLRVAGTS
jgi:protein-S-isoprenylcysteine O-methyltransferase Ste14